MNGIRRSHRFDVEGTHGLNVVADTHDNLGVTRAAFGERSVGRDVEDVEANLKYVRTWLLPEQRHGFGDSV